MASAAHIAIQPTGGDGTPQDNSTKMPLPQKYDGDRTKCDNFLHKCSAYFTLYDTHFNTELKKITFILLLCDNEAADWAGTQID